MASWRVSSDKACSACAPDQNVTFVVSTCGDEVMFTLRENDTDEAVSIHVTWDAWESMREFLDGPQSAHVYRNGTHHAQNVYRIIDPDNPKGDMFIGHVCDPENAKRVVRALNNTQ